MIRRILDKLKPETAAVHEELAQGANAHNLHQAFQLFSTETRRLEEAYQDLQEHIQTANRELEESNRSLQAKIVELDSVSQYMNSIISHISQGLLFVTLSGVVSTYNRQAEHLLTTPAKKVLFHPFWEHFPDDLFGFSLRQALATHHAPPNHYHTFYSDDGARKDIEVSSNFVLAGNPDYHGLVILIRDITKLRYLQVIANRHDRMKELGEMAAAVAHEIRNPLGGIEGFAALLVRDLADTPPLQQMAQYIVDGSKTLNTLVSQVLEYSRPLQLTLKSTPLQPFIEKIIALIHADKSLANGVAITLESDPLPVEVSVDAPVLQRALFNLIVNAYQAIAGEGRVTIRLSHDSREVQIAIEDTGVGIPPEHLEKIFSPFFTTKQQGTGLGLAEVHKIIKAHDGDIEVSSTVGQGTSFLVRLPYLNGTC